MRQLLLVVVSSFSLSAFAQEDVQDVDTTVSAPGMQLNMNMKVRNGQQAPAAAPAAPPARGALGDVSIECAPANGVRPSVIKFVSPEGVLAQIYAEDGSLAGQYTVPFNFQGRGDTYYRFVLQGADGSLLLDKKLEAKMYVGCLARVKVGRGPQAQAPAPAAAGLGMGAADFQALLDAVNEEGFSDGKLRVLATASQNQAFTVAQVGQLIDAMSFSADKLKALEITRSHIVDRQNNFRLLERFTFSGDKQKAQALLR